MNYSKQSFYTKSDIFRMLDSEILCVRSKIALKLLKFASCLIDLCVIQNSNSWFFKVKKIHITGLRTDSLYICIVISFISDKKVTETHRRLTLPYDKTDRLLATDKKLVQNYVDSKNKISHFSSTMPLSKFTVHQ